MFESIDIVEKLKEEQSEFSLTPLQDVLDKEAANDLKLTQSIKSSGGNPVSIDLPEDAVVFDLAVIQRICEDYRLRFLPGKFFKAEIPYEALIRIKEMERKTGSEIRDFMIIAPADLFDLKDEYEDPVLLAPLGDNRFLFIHKWGNDMTWYRKYIYYPIRNFETYLATLFTLSFVFSMIIPWNWIVRERWLYEESFFYYRIMLFGSCLTWLFVMSFYYGFVSRKNFSRSDWNNVYFNK